MKWNFEPSLSRQELEHDFKFAPHFDEKGLLPVITTDASTGKVLMFAYMNKEALTRTLELKEAVYWSRSRKQLWHKGLESGFTQKVEEIQVDCDQDVLLLRVRVEGSGVCHTGFDSCFFRNLPLPPSAKEGEVLELKAIADVKKVFDPAQVYGKKS